MKKRFVAMLMTTACFAFSACQGTAKGVAAGNVHKTEASENEMASCDVFAMDTYMSVTAYGENARKAVELAEAEILRLEALLSATDAGSEVAKLNREHGGVLSEDTSYLFGRSEELFSGTGGAFDIAVYPLMQAWGFPTGEYEVPAPDVIQQLLHAADAAQIDYDGEQNKVSFGREDMQIDFGGIAKGYTSSRIMEIFRECGVTSGIVNLGGNVHTLGKKQDQSLWKVAVQSPDADNDYLGVLSVSDRAVITSGGYERCFERDGKTYHHILDPATGYPADSGLRSVTVISADGTLADGLSTALFVMGKDKAVAYWKEHSEAYDFVLYAKDGKLYVTEGIIDAFTSDYEIEKISKEESD